MALSTGTKLGLYEILSPLGAGGMGEVYLAQDTELGRDVAIKVLSKSMTQDGERVARFEREARLLAALNHPNIASIYGFDDVEGTRSLVMEYVTGTPYRRPGMHYRRMRSTAAPGSSRNIRCLHAWS